MLSPEGWLAAAEVECHPTRRGKPPFLTEHNFVALSPVRYRRVALVNAVADAPRCFRTEWFPRLNGVASLPLLYLSPSGRRNSKKCC
ncbi:MAG TPA: hypothetical protein VFH15_02795 [Pyrinomonadaceae bacterium]|nr:hypothetical protein [Pyrinomonadaceae bacterium]